MSALIYYNLDLLGLQISTPIQVSRHCSTVAFECQDLTYYIVEFHHVVLDRCDLRIKAEPATPTFKSMPRLHSPGKHTGPKRRSAIRGRRITREYVSSESCPF